MLDFQPCLVCIAAGSYVARSVSLKLHVVRMDLEYQLAHRLAEFLAADGIAACRTPRDGRPSFAFRASLTGGGRAASMRLAQADSNIVTKEQPPWA